MKSQSGQVLSQLRTSSSALLHPFLPLPVCELHSLELVISTMWNQGSDPHGHREEEDFLHQIHFEKPPREDSVWSSLRHMSMLESVMWLGS